MQRARKKDDIARLIKSVAEYDVDLFPYTHRDIYPSIWVYPAGFLGSVKEREERITRLFWDPKINYDAIVLLVPGKRYELILTPIPH